MKSRFRLRPPKHRMAQASGRAMRPVIFPVAWEDGNPVQFPRAPAAPQITVDIAAEAVRGALADIAKDAAIGELCPVLDDVVDADRTRPRARFDDVHSAFV